jgi:exopolyphosphatase / guanosine-5'-triphosphate,3'-diphosphate pyrophosphatase
MMQIAALDLGSNSFHLVVVDASPDGSIVPLLREKEMLRLGDVVSREGVVTRSAQARAIGAVRRFKALADAAGSEEMVACATSAIREAANGGELVDAIFAETGVRVRVLSGRDEARLIYEAVRASVLIEPGPALCLDLGGGSLELVVGDAERLYWARSVPLGVARLTVELVRGDPPSRDDQRRLRERLTAVLAPMAEEVAAYAPTMAIGTSGTFCALGRMVAARRTGSVPDSVNQLTVGREELLAVHRQIMASTSAERSRIPGLDARRADLMPAGSTLLVTAMELFGLDDLTLSDWALREGIILDAIAQHDPGELSRDKRDIRRASVLQLARRCGWDETHGRQVARLATALFDQTQEVHGLGPDDRDLLDYAGLLHDIGQHISSESHHKHTAYLVQHGRLRGFDPEEIDALAALARYHRRSEPKPSHEPFASLPPERRERVTLLAGILRVADGLDYGHTGSVQDVEVETDGSTLRVWTRSGEDIEIELWGARRKRALMERTLGRRLEFRPLGPAGRNGHALAAANGRAAA